MIMKCGHSDNGTLTSKIHGLVDVRCCTICDYPDNVTPMSADQLPDLTGRKAKCNSCGNLTESNIDLAFFKSTPEKSYDEYYCGCYGWN